MNERHNKWVPVEPGTVIPAGQPYMIERVYPEDHSAAGAGDFLPGEECRWFIDSSWRPPLELPTEPTWGIAVIKAGAHSAGPYAFGKHVHEQNAHGEYLRWTPNRSVSVEDVLGFIRLSDKQVERIEGQR